MPVIFNLFLSAALISGALWIAKSNPILGGFVISLPLSTLIALALSKFQNGDDGSSYLLAKSIFIGVPSTLVFFVPFLIAERFKLSFWFCYASGLLLLVAGYFVHRSITSLFLK